MATQNPTITALYNLIKATDDAPVTTVTALCVRVAGDAAGGVMLETILKWHGKMGDDFYISNREWREQTGFSDAVINRVKRQVFAKCGVMCHVRFNKKAYANVTHYRVLFSTLARRISQALETAWFATTKRLRALLTNVSQESTETISINTTKKTSIKNDDNDSPLSEEKADSSSSTENPVYSLLVKHGVNAKVAKKYQHLNIGKVEDAVRQSLNAENVPACIVWRLKQETPPPNPLPKALERGNQADDTVSIDHAAFKFFNVDVPKAPEVNDKQLATVVGKNTAADVWKLMMSQMELQAENIFHDLERCTVVGYESGEYVVWTRFEATRTYLQHRAYRNIWRLLTDISGEDVAVRFVLPDEISEVDKGDSPPLNLRHCVGET